MDGMISPVPLFNSGMEVEMYYLHFYMGHCDTKNIFLSPSLEIIKEIGIEPLSIYQPIIISINKEGLFSDLEEIFHKEPEKIIFLLSDDVLPEEPYISKILNLKEKGFQFAFQNVTDLEIYEPILIHTNYIFINAVTIDMYHLERLLKLRREILPKLKIIATHVENIDQFNILRKRKISYFWGNFYQAPVSKGRTKISPLKVNLVQLINIARNKDFDFDEISAIIIKDAALSFSLLQTINSVFYGLRKEIKTINHAVVILGQEEVRKWITVTATRMLGTDKPDEVTRLSLVRAKYAENLAKSFGLDNDSASLFMMGMFSVLDIILEMEMANVHKIIQMSDDIYDALVNQTGRFGPVLAFIKSYEMADWDAVTRAIIIHDLEVEDIYSAFVNAMGWYKSVIN